MRAPCLSSTPHGLLLLHACLLGARSGDGVPARLCTSGGARHAWLCDPCNAVCFVAARRPPRHLRICRTALCAQVLAAHEGPPLLLTAYHPARKRGALDVNCLLPSNQALQCFPPRRRAGGPCGAAAEVVLHRPVLAVRAHDARAAARAFPVVRPARRSAHCPARRPAARSAGAALRVCPVAPGVASAAA